MSALTTKFIGTLPFRSSGGLSLPKVTSAIFSRECSRAEKRTTLMRKSYFPSRRRNTLAYAVYRLGARLSSLLDSNISDGNGSSVLAHVSITTKTTVVSGFASIHVSNAGLNFTRG